MTPPIVTRGELIAIEARTWIGTPVHEQQSVKGHGVDCKGLVAGAARELGFPEASSIYALDIGYVIFRRGGIPVPRLMEGLAATFDRVPRGAPFALGDVLLVRVHGIAQHLAIVVSETTVVHASHHRKESRSIVKETELEALLHPSVCPLVAAYRWRELEESR